MAHGKGDWVHAPIQVPGKISKIADHNLHCTVQYIIWASMSRPAAPSRRDIAEPSARRREVLNAARDAFLRDGFGRISMDDVAVAANVARRTVYNQFGSKTDLFHAVVADSWGHIEPGDLIREASHGKTPREGLYAIGMAIADHWAAPIALALLRLCIVEGDRFPDLPRSFYRYGKEPITMAVRDYLSKLVEDGILILDDPFVATQQFIGMINEPLLWMRLIDTDGHASPAHQRQIVGRAVSLFFGGYAPPPQAAA